MTTCLHTKLSRKLIPGFTGLQQKWTCNDCGEEVSNELPQQRRKLFREEAIQELSKEIEQTQEKLIENLEKQVDGYTARLVKANGLIENLHDALQQQEKMLAAMLQTEISLRTENASLRKAVDEVLKMMDVISQSYPPTPRGAEVIENLRKALETGE